MATLNKRLKFIRAALATWASDLFSGRAGVVTDSLPDTVERWGWNDSGTWKYSARSGANETFSGIKNTSLTPNTLIRHTASGEADSCFSDDGTTASITRPLTLNGATHPAWDPAFKTLSIGGNATLYANAVGGSTKLTFSRNLYVAGGVVKAINSATGTDFPVFLEFTDQGGIEFWRSSANPTADVAITDLGPRLSLSGAGLLSVPSISITTPVTRECIMQSLPITNSAPGVVTVVSGGMKSFGFDGGASTEELFYHVDVQHDYKAGTDMTFHVHWIPATATGGDVKWQVEYQWVEAGATWPAPTLVTGTTAAGTTAWADKRTDFTLSGTGHTYNSRIMFRLFRNPVDAADTYAGDAVLTSVGCHYSADIGQA